MSTNPLSKMYWLHGLTPLHVGAGRGVGFIDLPIMREKVTGWPLVPGSALKGVLANHHSATVSQRASCEKRRAAFGVADTESGTTESNASGAGSGQPPNQAGALVFTDARLVCLPVRSLFGTFAWVTSPLALQRLTRDARHSGLTDLPAEIPTPGAECLLTCPETVLSADERAYFDDLDFSAATDVTTQSWSTWLGNAVFGAATPWHGVFCQRFAVVADPVFDFLSENATEVNARVRIDEDYKTVAKGALWYEESLPAESILAGIVTCCWVGGKKFEPGVLLDEFCQGEAQFQMGGKATTGKGIVRCRFGNSAAVVGNTVIL